MSRVELSARCAVALTFVLLGACQAELGGEPELANFENGPGPDPDARPAQDRVVSPEGGVWTSSAGWNVPRTEPAAPDTATEDRYWDFWRGDHVSDWTDDGLTFVESDGPYGIFRVTGPNARLIGPRIENPARGEVLVMLCTSYFVFPPEGTSLSAEEHTFVEVVNPSEHEPVAQVFQQGIVGGCSPTADAAYRHDGPTLTEVVVQVTPPPPMDTIVAISRLSIDVPERDYHQGGDRPPICCGRCDPNVDEFCAAEDKYCVAAGDWTPPPDGASPWMPTEQPAS